MKNRLLVSMVALSLLLSMKDAHPQASEITSDGIGSLMQHCFENRLFNGVILIAKGDSIIFQNTYGNAVMEWNITHTMNTKFRIASCTKQFTAMLILQLVVQGKLSLTEPISTYIPQFHKPSADSINIHQLLSHTSGAPSWRNITESYNEYWYTDFSLDDILVFFENSHLITQPGSKFKYGSIGYVLLVAIIENITHMSYEEALSEIILKPLKMNNSGILNVYEQKKITLLPMKILIFPIMFQNIIILLMHWEQAVWFQLPMTC